MGILSPFSIEPISRSNTIVAGSHSREEPNFGAQDRLGGTTPSTTEEQYEVARSDSPTSSSVTVRDSNQGDLPHDTLQTRRSKAGSVEAALKVHFGCRICLSNPTPTSYPTATHCGHLFCYECIAAEVLKTSRCPVCKTVLALYCLFKLDVAM
ncbi:hypothetical protein BDM02DRAFT_3118282 [Thelephora ganbajun]|uniref:Uncharacterized protein n=1 Tax=Thelephora ganbajun TaxID=370292 RepID=A0ACB6ZB87_THEGA|nr:hypothetical protein BDM02DRAFT_3118282 [Thelephora ganbajun]